MSKIRLAPSNSRDPVAGKLDLHTGLPNVLTPAMAALAKCTSKPQVLEALESVPEFLFPMIRRAMAQRPAMFPREIYLATQETLKFHALCGEIVKIGAVIP